MIKKFNLIDLIDYCKKNPNACTCGCFRWWYRPRTGSSKIKSASAGWSSHLEARFLMLWDPVSLWVCDFVKSHERLAKGSTYNQWGSVSLKVVRVWISFSDDFTKHYMYYDTHVIPSVHARCQRVQEDKFISTLFENWQLQLLPMTEAPYLTDHDMYTGFNNCLSCHHIQEIFMVGKDFSGKINWSVKLNGTFCVQI